VLFRPKERKNSKPSFSVNTNSIICSRGMREVPVELIFLQGKEDHDEEDMVFVWVAMIGYADVMD